jgi:hypothetical protein
MKQVRLCKFEPLGTMHEPTPVTIIIDDIVPRYGLDEHNTWADEQANLLVDALYNALPQCTFDRVALRMFAKKVSSYVGRTE